MEYQRSRLLTDNSGGSDARNRGEHLVMPRRRQNLEHRAAGTAPLVRAGDGFVELGPAVLPTSAMRFWRGSGRRADGVPLVSHGKAEISCAPRPALGVSR
jgi:hypothetical protein